MPSARSTSWSGNRNTRTASSTMWPRSWSSGSPSVPQTGSAGMDLLDDDDGALDRPIRAGQRADARETPHRLTSPRGGLDHHGLAGSVAAERRCQCRTQRVHGKPDLEVQERLPLDLFAAQAPHLEREAVPDPDLQVRIDDHNGRVDAREHRLEVCVDLVDLGRPITQLFVDRVELFVRRRELLV